MKKLALPILILAGVFFVASASRAAEQTMCYDLYQPVCAAQVVECFTTPCYPQYHTYSNSCFMAAANATLIHTGECTAAESGSIKTDPIPPPATTTGEVHYVPPKGCTTWNDGCNTCSMSSNGAVACTLIGCLVDGPGYCIAYGASTTVSSSPHHGGTSLTSVHASTTVAATTSTSSVSITASTSASVTQSLHSFWYRIWHSFLHWFGF